MALNYFSVPYTVKQISKITDYKKEGGMYNRQIVDAIRTFSLQATLKKNISWEELAKLNTRDSVIIISWMLDGYIGHVSIIDKVTETHVFLAEPTSGKIQKIEKVRFLRQWWDFEGQNRDVWYPETKADVQLRVAIIVTV